MVTRVQRAGERSRAKYGIAAKVTRIELRRSLARSRGRQTEENRDDFATIRGTVVYAQCEELELAEEPIEEPLCGQRIELAGLYDGLQPGRWLIVTGERADLEGLEGEDLEPAVSLSRREGK